MTSEFRIQTNLLQQLTLHSLSLFFLPFDVTTHCRQLCPDAHLAKSARHNSVTIFFAEL